MRKYLLLTIYALIISYGNVYSREMLDYEELAKLPVSELFRQGDEHMKLNHLDTAMGYYIILAGKYDNGMDKSDKYLCTLACNAAGQIYYQKGNYSQAFDLYFKAIQIAEENDFGKLIAELYKNIGNIYSTFGDSPQAIDCYTKGLEYAKKYNNTSIEIKLLINLTGICCYGNRIPEAKAYYNEMMRFVGKDTLIEYFGYFNKALILSNENKYVPAITHFRNAAKYANHAGLAPKYIGSVYGELAGLYERMGQKDSALHYFRINMLYTEKNSLMYMYIENLKALARLYEQKGNENKSLQYKSRYLAVSDSLFNMDEFNRMKNAQFVYEMDKNYQKIASLTKEKEHKEIQIKTQKRFLIALCAGLLLFIILLIIVYVQKRKLYGAYTDLFNRNSEILQSNLQNKELRTEYENKLAEEKARYEKLEQQIKALTGDKEREIALTEEKNKETKLYSVNKLTDQQKENFIKDINKIMESTEEFCDSEFSLERLAALIGSNSRYVSQIINETYNKNFRTFVNEYRIKEARLRLMNTAEYGNYTIKAIAESVGYKSHTNFIDIFKKTTGITPSIYQKIAKQKNTVSS